MALIRPRFPTELDESLEEFVTRFFYGIGIPSTIVSALTFYLLARKNIFSTADVRVLMVLVQVSMFLYNFHFCTLFIPFIYPFTGGGFCMGLLCSLGVRFHYSMCLWLFTIIFTCASFITLLFARYQALLHPWSKIKLKPAPKLVFYITTFSSLSVIPVLFLFTDTSRDDQERMVEVVYQLDWVADHKVFSIVNGREKFLLAQVIKYVMVANIAVFGSITVIIFLLTLLKIFRISSYQSTNKAQRVYRAKIKNSIVILTQMVLSLLLGVVPLCVMVYAVGSADKGEQGVGQETMKIVLACEMITTSVSLINSAVFILGNKQYNKFRKIGIRNSNNRLFISLALLPTGAAREYVSLIAGQVRKTATMLNNNNRISSIDASNTYYSVLPIRSAK
ncbi:hypothetical protein PRIPAC_88067, partial [Pristionchus pacificus]|uniref:G protein-coupled receptor n=1 Tax=Pristionchus pacificus TaxID=54126 RepID=A0A2A6B7V9_PRIPA